MILRLTTLDVDRMFSLTSLGMVVATVSREYRRRVQRAASAAGFVPDLEPGTLTWWRHPDGRKIAFSHRYWGHKMMLFPSRQRSPLNPS